MGQNLLPCGREQELLLPPSLSEWLAEDHLAWFVLDAVAALDLGAFYASYRRHGWGAAAHDPQILVALLVYAYAIGERGLSPTRARGNYRSSKSPAVGEWCLSGPSFFPSLNCEQWDGGLCLGVSERRVKPRSGEHGITRSDS